MYVYTCAYTVYSSTALDTKIYSRPVCTHALYTPLIPFLHFSLLNLLPLFGEQPGRWLTNGVYCMCVMCTECIAIVYVYGTYVLVHNKSKTQAL